MTTLPARRPMREAGPHLPRRDLGRCLDDLETAISAARSLGLPVAAAEAVRTEAHDRLGIPADAYVLALIGGTGVGKSSLLNALAGTEVSRVGVRRPMTGEPLAWLAGDAAEVVGPMLDRLGVGTRRMHDHERFDGVVLLDLPDMDSVTADHRARVEELLPRVDAVAWITDPEKYADAVLYDAFLAKWLPRLDRQVVVLNKTDRLGPGDVRRVQTDLERRLAPLGRGGRVRVLHTSAVEPDGAVALRDWLAEAVDAKRVVLGRLGASVRAAVADLADAAGVHPSGAPRGLVGVPERRRVTRDATRAALRLVDIGGARRQAVAATRAAARRRGAGPLGRLTSFAYRLSGRQRRVADPGAHLRKWRERGPIAHVVEPVHDAIMAAIPGTPAPIRPTIASAADPGVLARRLSEAIDRSLPAPGSLNAPSSHIWSLLGLLQTTNLVVTVAAVVWTIVWVVARPPVDSVTLPVLGPVPAPSVLLVAALASGFLLARVLGLHASWRGRRWAAEVSGRIERSIVAAMEREAFAPVDRLDVQRRRLWHAARGVAASCE